MKGTDGFTFEEFISLPSHLLGDCELIDGEIVPRHEPESQLNKQEELLRIRILTRLEHLPNSIWVCVLRNQFALDEGELNFV